LGCNARPVASVLEERRADNLRQPVIIIRAEGNPQRKPLIPPPAGSIIIAGNAMSFTLTSSAFAANEKIPLRYSGDGEDISPPLAWDGVPSGTQELALICDDPDAPGAQPWVHWVIYGLEPQLRALPEGLPASAETKKPFAGLQGKNSWGKLGYGGPYPPKAGGVHHYRFTLYMLSKLLGAKPGLDKAGLLGAMQGLILAQTALTGLYERK
jgi:Raf kinase inhibitor-like YbhB/YbcL family protein